MSDAYALYLGQNRDKARRVLDAAPHGSLMVIKPAKRTLDQNAKMHAMLADVALSMPDGRRMTPDEWKCAFMAACGWECQFIEGLNGRPLPIGYRSSKMSKAQMSDLIEFIQSYGDEHGVRWSDDSQQEAA